MTTRKFHICDTEGQPAEINLIDNGDGTYSMLTGDGAFTGTFNGAVGGTTPAAGAFTHVTSIDVSTTGINTRSIAAGLTASVTQTLAGALALTKAINEVATSANTGDAVKLAALAAGQEQEVWNDGAHSVSVFPASGTVAIDGGTAGAAVTLSAGARAKFTCTATNVVKSYLLRAVSA